MPELPEVETTVRQLQRLRGKRVLDAWSDWPRFFKNSSLKKFRKDIKGARIERVLRRGKNILIYLSKKDITPEFLLLIHQKMTGHLLVGRWRYGGGRWLSVEKGPLAHKKNSYIHLLFRLSGDLMLALSDARKFAKVVLGAAPDIEASEHLRLGVEAIDPDLTPTVFKKLIHNRKKKIKLVLLDQSIIAGLGNIYSDEALWFARLNPQKPANRLTPNELKKLYLATRMVLRKAIRLGGTSISDYRDLRGRPGRYLEARVVYRRSGEPCLRCSAKIQRIKVGSRSSSFCPQCQSL